MCAKEIVIHMGNVCLCQWTPYINVRGHWGNYKNKKAGPYPSISRGSYKEWKSSTNRHFLAREENWIMLCRLWSGLLSALGRKGTSPPPISVLAFRQPICGIQQLNWYLIGRRESPLTGRAVALTVRGPPLLLVLRRARAGLHCAVDERVELDFRPRCGAAPAFLTGVSKQQLVNVSWRMKRRQAERNKKLHAGSSRLTTTTEAKTSVAKRDMY